MDLNQVIRVQGRALFLWEVSDIQHLIDQHPQWSRHQVAKELCERWDWRTPLGQLKTFAARSLLLKLEQRQQLRLPPLQVQQRRRPWGLSSNSVVALPPACAVEGPLERLGPLLWHLCAYGTPGRERALGYLRQYHYLGCTRPVGTHLLYLVQDGQSRDLAVHLVGAAAWQCAARDEYIGWSAPARRQHLPQIGNHSRFLILPWVQVPQLASHLLGQLTRRVAGDWRDRHGWKLLLLETFVESGRFSGTAYRAANWQPVGQTTGRTRQEKQHRASAPPKTVWVYPLTPKFRESLRALPPQSGGAHE
jgi:hypothetical protein